MAVGRKNEHMRFNGAGRHFADNFSGGGVDNVKRVGKFSTDVEHAVGTKFRAVRADRLIEGDDASRVRGVQINYMDGVAVGPGPADAGIAVDWDVAELTVWGTATSWRLISTPA